MTHETSDVQSSNIGDGTTIWQYCVVLPGAVIGRNCNLNCHVFVENDVVIGDDVTVKSGVQIWDGITLEDGVFIGPNVTFTNDPLPRSKQYPETFDTTIVRKGASIGSNATVLSGVEIGRYALIGAGAVATKDVDPYTVWYGNPARHRGYVAEDNVLLDLDLQDEEGTQYELVDCKPVLP
jgi:acetyltransferase-like isoleucine patch superfamily enzyme